MGITFTVAQNKFADNLTTTALALAVKTWLDALTVTTVYSLTVVHLNGFYVILVIYV